MTLYHKFKITDHAIPPVNQYGSFVIKYIENKTGEVEATHTLKWLKLLLNSLAAERNWPETLVKGGELLVNHDGLQHVFDVSQRSGDTSRIQSMGWKPGQKIVF